MRIQKLKGYYNGNVFNVREVQFQGTIHEDETLELRTNSAGDLSFKNPVYRVAIWQMFQMKNWIAM